MRNGCVQSRRRRAAPGVPDQRRSRVSQATDEPNGGRSGRSWLRQRWASGWWMCSCGASGCSTIRRAGDCDRAVVASAFRPKEWPRWFVASAFRRKEQSRVRRVLSEREIGACRAEAYRLGGTWSAGGWHASGNLRDDCRCVASRGRSAHAARHVLGSLCGLHHHRSGAAAADHAHRVPARHPKRMAAAF